MLPEGILKSDPSPNRHFADLLILFSEFKCVHKSAKCRFGDRKMNQNFDPEISNVSISGLKKLNITLKVVRNRLLYQNISHPKHSPQPHSHESEQV